jgi:hypothetical protein
VTGVAFTPPPLAHTGAPGVPALNNSKREARGRQGRAAEPGRTRDANVCIKNCPHALQTGSLSAPLSATFFFARLLNIFIFDVTPGLSRLSQSISPPSM